MWRVILALACACPSVPALPSDGGPAWLELTSEHFTVWTDASPELGRAFVQRMENVRQVLYGSSFFRVQARSKTFVAAFRSWREADAFLDNNSIAEAWPPANPALQPAIVIDASELSGEPSVLTHELAHVISHEAIPHQPQWFSEALATYYETLKLDEQTGTAELGAPNERWVGVLHSFKPTDMWRMLECNDPPCMVPESFHAWAWLLFSYLVNNREAQLLQYMRRLIETSDSDQSKLWAEVFPDLPPSLLDHELSVWLATGELRVHRFHVDLKQWQVSQRALNDADVLAMRGLLYDLKARHFLRPLDDVPSEIRSALRIDPTNVLARMVERSIRNVLPLAVARAVVAAHRMDWRAWWLLWKSLSPGSEVDDAHHHICELIHENPGWLPIGFCPESAAN